jgi:hypothetical protein
MKTIFGIAGFELLLSVFIGVITVYLTKVLIMRFYLRKTGEHDPYKNLSFMIFLSGTVFSVSFITYGIMDPMTATFKVLEDSGIMGWELIYSCTEYVGIFLLMAYIFSTLVILISYQLFSFLTTNLNEYEEIRDNNVGVALLVVVLTIVTALFAKAPFIVYLESFIPYPDLPGIS